MFFKSALIAIISASLAAATHTYTANPPKPTPEPASDCATGDAQCCNNVVTATNPLALAVFHSLDIAVVPDDVLVGLGCTPITIVGGTGVCNQSPVCCENNDFDGVVNIGCTTIVL